MKSNTGANLGFEAKLWMAADKLRGTMDAAEYKHVVLGLIFLKYISDAFWEKYKALKAEKFADPEDRDEYLADIVPHQHVLTPGRYVGAEAIEDDGVPFEEKMSGLTDTLYAQMKKSVELDEVIRKNLEALGYGE